MNIETETWYETPDHGEQYVVSVCRVGEQYDTETDDLSGDTTIVVSCSVETDGYGAMPPISPLELDEFDGATKLDPQPGESYRAD